jgi:hypothetical protein
MPRGIPKAKTDPPTKPDTESEINSSPELDKLRKELEEAKAKMAEILAKQQPPEEEVGPPPTQEPVVQKTISRRIPVHTMPGKAIDVTEHGYDFQNIHIRADVPVEVLAQAFNARVGESQKGEEIKEAFFHPQSMINLYANSGKKRRIRVINGVVEYGTEKFPVPLINPEVILRVLEDRWRNDRKARSFFAGTKEVEYAKSLANIKKVYALL